MNVYTQNHRAACILRTSCWEMDISSFNRSEMSSKGSQTGLKHKLGCTPYRRCVLLRKLTKTHRRSHVGSANGHLEFHSVGVEFNTVSDRFESRIRVVNTFYRRGVLYGKRAKTHRRRRNIVGTRTFLSSRVGFDREVFMSALPKQMPAECAEYRRDRRKIRTFYRKKSVKHDGVRI